MTYLEKISIEKNNSHEIRLYPEGSLFLNAFEKSAYAFCYHIKAFKVNVKTLKSLTTPFVSIGFPTSKKDEYLKGYTTKNENDCIVIQLDEQIDEKDFQKWKASIIEEYNLKNKNQENYENKNLLETQKATSFNERMEENVNLSLRMFVKEIKELNLAMMTPMDSLNFLSDLQKRIKNSNL